MTDAPRWRDAVTAAETLTGAERRTLLLLSQIPLIWEGAIESLLDLRGGASVYRCLARLRERGLVDEIRPALRAGRNPGLLYLTNLGIATIAVDQDWNPERFARHQRLRRADLLARVPGLPHVLATYQILGALAAARPGPVNLVSWEQPWRRTFRRPGTQSKVAVRLPARVVLSRRDEITECFLIPDLATFPLRAHRPVLGRLMLLRRLIDGEFPTLAIATTDARLASWTRLLDDMARSRGHPPLAASIATWGALRVGTTSFGEIAASGTSSLSDRCLKIRPNRPRRSGTTIARLIGGKSGSGLPDSEPGHIALEVTAQERLLLDLVGRHPFLSAESLATVLGWDVRRLRQRRRHLVALRLLRCLDGREPGNWPADDLTELTEAGLAFASAQQGLSVAGAVRFNGLVGGGPDCPTGSRRLLLRNFEHTVGADSLFVSLYRAVRNIGASDADDAVLEWRDAAACNRRRVHPDGYGMLRLQGQLHGFFLEYDRGTMSARDYASKWAAYYDYRDSRDFENDYDGFPTILVVTTDSAVEEIIARTVRAASVGRLPMLPVLLTSEWRITRDPTNSHGMLGPIWRGAWTGFHALTRWPALTTKGMPRSP
jgi:hypothetical protein